MGSPKKIQLIARYVWTTNIWNIFMAVRTISIVFKKQVAGFYTSVANNEEAGTREICKSPPSSHKPWASS
jgi:hypothetical protein